MTNHQKPHHWPSWHFWGIRHFVTNMRHTQNGSRRESRLCGWVGSSCKHHKHWLLGCPNLKPHKNNNTTLSSKFLQALPLKFHGPQLVLFSCGTSLHWACTTCRWAFATSSHLKRQRWRSHHRIWDKRLPRTFFEHPVFSTFSDLNHAHAPCSEGAPMVVRISMPWCHGSYSGW